MRRTQKLASVMLLPAALCLISIGNHALAAQTTTTIISASIVGGSCDIAVPPSVPFGEVQAADITTTSNIAKTFDLTLSGCNGYGLTPSITVSGLLDSDSGKDLFVTPETTTSKGYGILLSTAGNSNFEQNDNLATTNTISAKGTSWDLEQAVTLNGKIPLKAVLSCGDCVANTLQGGALNASLTFNFLYQ